jgi:hypothetical protein
VLTKVLIYGLFLGFKSVRIGLGGLVRLPLFDVALASYLGKEALGLE